MGAPLALIADLRVEHGKKTKASLSMTTLYHNPLSPFCRKVRLHLGEKQMQVRLIDEKYWLKSSEFLMRNPAGKVPVLKLDGQIFCDSRAICEYLDGYKPTQDQIFTEPSAYQASPPLIPKGAQDQYEMRRLIAFFDEVFYHDVTMNLLYERVFRSLTGQGYPVAANIKAGMQAIKKHMTDIEGLLNQRAWLAGRRITLADLAAAAHLSAIDYIGDVDWGQSSNVKNWYAKIKSRRSFQPLLADFIPGIVPPLHYADPDF